MAYAIMRHAKLKSAGSIAGSIQHTYRERETPNADPTKTPDNEVIVQYDIEKCKKDIESGRTRSDNVEIIEFVFTTSPEWMEEATAEQKKEFENKTLEFLKDEFGKENIQSLVWHKDETTDHMTGHVTPRDEEGHLNAKKWLGGKQKLRELQDRYADKVKDLGLERGERGSKAHHQEVSQYYARVNQSKQLEKEVDNQQWKHLKAPNPTLSDRLDIEKYRNKVALSVRDQMIDREKNHITRIKELEHELKTNSNVKENKALKAKLTTVKKELGVTKKELHDMKHLHNRLEELEEINPQIKKEYHKANRMEWERKTPDQRLSEVDKQLSKAEPGSSQTRWLVNERMKALEQISQERQIKREQERSKNRGVER